MAVEKLLPQNIEAEAGVLGSLLIDPGAIVQVADFLRPEDFYREAHREIYRAVLDLYETSDPADLITLTDELQRRGKLDEVGGISYVSSLANQVPTSANVEYYGRIVERTSVLRRLISAAGQIAAVAYSEPDASTALDEAEKLVFNVSQRFTRDDLEPLRETLREYIDKLDQLHEHRGTIVGVATGFSDLDKMTGGLQKSDLIILAARPAVGKCLTAHTLIDDPETGERLTIEECVRRRQKRIYGLSETGEVRVTDIADWIDSGVQPCYRVRTRTGRIVEVTGHHPFLTVHGWMPLHDLRVGSSIAVPTAVPAFGRDESWPIELVRLLAYFIAEGGLTDGSPEFTNTDPAIIEDFRAIIAHHFPACAIRQEKITYIVAQPRTAEAMRGRGFVMPPNPVTRWLRELGLWGKLAREKRFPSCVWTWSRSYLAEFVRILMSCDGSIYPVAGDPRIEFTVASPGLADDLHHAFTRFGIIAKRYTTSMGAERVEITSPDAIRIYQREIGWFGEKTQRFAEPALRVRQHPGNAGHAPKEVWPLVMAAARSQGLAMVELARRSGETTSVGKYGGYNAHTHRGLPRHRLVRYGEVLGDATLRRLGSPEIYWDEIVAIEDIGERQVYDLTVPDGENFIAQDVIVHNTAMALSLAHNASLRFGRKIAVFSLEMSKEQLAARMLSMDAAVDQQKLRTGNINDEEWDRISESVGRLSEANIYIDDTPGITMVEMRSKARRLMMEHGFDLLIVDYLQLMQGSGAGRGHENRVMEISEISRGLKGLARELNVPVLALSQLSRAVESRTEKKPQLSDLRESGSIEQDADIVMFIYRDEVYNPDSERKNIADIIVAKHRNGPIGQVSLYFLAAQTLYRDLDLRTPEDY
jgi:replicative DNA helicase